MIEWTSEAVMSGVGKQNAELAHPAGRVMVEVVNMRSEGKFLDQVLSRGIVYIIEAFSYQIPFSLLFSYLLLPPIPS